MSASDALAGPPGLTLAEEQRLTTVNRIVRAREGVGRAHERISRPSNAPSLRHRSMNSKNATGPPG